MVKTEKITFRVSEALKKKIILRANDEKRTVADYIRLLIEKDLEENRR